MFDKMLMPFQILYHYAIQCLNTHSVNMIHIGKYGIQQNTYAMNNDNTELSFSKSFIKIITKYMLQNTSVNILLIC